MNTRKGQEEVWKNLEKMKPKCVIFNNPSPIAKRNQIFKFCLEVMKWQQQEGRNYLVIAPARSNFEYFLFPTPYSSLLKGETLFKILDMRDLVNCDDKCRWITLITSIEELEHTSLPKYEEERKSKFLWKDPSWKFLPSQLCVFLQRVLANSPMRDFRQNFLMEDVLEDFRDGDRCATCMCAEREPSRSFLLRDSSEEVTSIPVPLRHIFPQKFTTSVLIQTLRKIDLLAHGTEVSVKESTDLKIQELIPGLQEMRRRTLPHMYFEACSLFRGTFGRVYPFFQHPEDSVLLMWRLGDYDHVYFMFVTQLYPHFSEFDVRE